MQSIFEELNTYIDNLQTHKILENIYSRYQKIFEKSAFQFPFDNYSWKEYEETHNSKIKYYNRYYQANLPLLESKPFTFQKKLESLKHKVNRNEIPKEHKEMLSLLKYSDFRNPVIEKEIEKLEREENNHKSLYAFYDRFTKTNNINKIVSEFEKTILKLIFNKFNELVQKYSTYSVKFDTKRLHKEYNEFMKKEQARNKEFNTNLKCFFEQLPLYLVKYKVIDNKEYSVTVEQRKKDDASVYIVIKDLLASTKQSKLVALRNDILEQNEEFAKEIAFLEKINGKKYDKELVSNYITYLAKNKDENYVQDLRLYLAINTELSKIKDSQFFSIFSKSEMEESSFKDNILKDTFGIEFELGERKSQFSGLAGIAGIPDSYKDAKEKYVSYLKVEDFVLIEKNDDNM